MPLFISPNTVDAIVESFAAVAIGGAGIALSELHRQSHQQRDGLSESRQRIVTIQESVRRDIAQQIHGRVQNRLIVFLHRLAQLQQAVSRKETAAELGELHQGLTELLQRDMHSISHRLYPSILRQGLIPALESLGEQFEAAVTVKMEVDKDLISIKL